MKVNFIKNMAAKAMVLIMVTCCFSLHGQWRQVDKIVAGDRDANNLFGSSVSISGDYAIVGVPQNSVDESGNNFLAGSGAAYIYKKNESGNWIQVQKIVASDRASSDSFGNSVAISGDYAVVGAYFKWGEDLGGNPLFAVGAAYIFKNDGSNWVEIQKLVGVPPAELDLFGQSVAIYDDYVVVGAPGDNSNAGVAYLYKNDGSGNWASVGQIKSNDLSAGDRFGNAVAIHGDYAVIGASQEQHDESGGNPQINSGSAYIFKNNGSDFWSQQTKIVASDRSSPDRFGSSVSIYGDYAIIGAANKAAAEASGGSLISAGAAYIFKKDAAEAWIEEEKLVASDFNTSDRFGSTVAISDMYAIVGAPFEDEDYAGNNTTTDSGSIYIFKSDGHGNWAQQSKMTATNRNEKDEFGISVATSDGLVIVGAHKEDEDQSEENTIENGGAAYFLQYKDPQVISLDASENKKYGESFDLPETSDAGLAITYVSENEALATVDMNTVSAVGIGTVNITATQAGNDSYWEAEEVSQSLTIGKAELTVTAHDKNKAYGDQNPALTFIYDGFVFSEGANDLDTEPAVDSEADEASDVGNYPINTTGGASENYFFSHIPGTMTITKAPLTVRADNKEKSYGEPNPTLTYSYSGFVSGENESDLSQTPDIVTDAVQTSETGDYSITTSGGQADNYELSYVSGSLTVTKASLTATASSYTITEGENLPASLEINYSGFVLNEDVSVIDTAPTASTEVNDSSTPGTYDIDVSGGLDNNYDFIYEKGTLTINKVLSVLKENEITIYPNPASELIRIGNAKVDEVIIYDLKGNKVLSGHGQIVNISALKSGMYILKLKDSEGSVLSSNRIVKK